MEEGWSDKYKKSIDCNNPKGFSQKAHCAGRTKRETIMNLKSLAKETIKEVVVERQINLFVEKNSPTNPSKWAYYKSQAKRNEGLWYFVDYKSQADKKIYFTDYKSNSDITIFFVDYKSQAGWQDKSKKHLLY